MPENENPNSYNYNPNRPQGSTNPQNPEEHADTKKVVDTAAKGAAEYFAPGVGGMAYDAAKKVPGVGETLDKTTGAVALAADQVPGVKKNTKGLNDSGITDAADGAISLIGSKGASGAKEAGEVVKNTGSVPKRNIASSGDAPTSESMAPATSMRKNVSFNSMMQQENIDEGIEEVNTGEEDSMNEPDLSSDIPSDVIQNDNPSADDSNQEGKGEVSGQFLDSLWKRFKIPIILGIGGIALFFLILIIIFGGASQEGLNTGYVDTLCNYNDTKVSITNCYQSNSDKESLAVYNLDDYVMRMAYAYTNGKEYSEETIKALMIVLKTNVLSQGNYNSSDKNIEVRICDVFNDYEQAPDDNSDELWMLDAPENDLSNLETLYTDISNYLYISSSYRSTISNLSSQNLLNFNESTLDEFEDMANSGNTYSQILNRFYNTDSNDESEDTVFRDVLFLGDSRTRGMQNAGVINSSNTIYGVSYGYDWLVGNGTFSSGNTNSMTGGIQGINNLMRDNADYNIVIWLGVNDLGNAEAYYQEYQALATGEWSNHNIYVVSVGPVDDNLSQYAKNETIQNFNNTMSNLINSSGLDNLFYIDLGYTQESIHEYDSVGIHYSSEDYVAIYDIIMSHVDNSLNAEYQLYNLTSYCTYYTLTENDAYWWPVGSEEATQGNIYGGDPVSVSITSTFGGRYHPTTGEWQDAHGAIDIGGVGTGTPVIATKSGEINFVNTGCSVGDHSCGGSYGNYIKIDHGDGIESLYAHLSEVLVSKGDSVNQGQIIGYTGNTGRSTGPHLHFEIRLNGTRVDPLDYVDPENPRPIAGGILTGGDITIVGDTGDYSDYDHNKSVVCNSLLASGFSVNAVVGIMANMESESAHTYNPAVVEYGSGYNLETIYDAPSTVAAGFGLIQWSFGRRVQLIEYAQERNWEAASMQAQLNYLYYEITNKSSYSITNKYLTGNYSGYDTAVAFCKNFERPSGSKSDLNASDSCTARADNNVSVITQYVTNGCSD